MCAEMLASRVFGVWDEVDVDGGVNLCVEFGMNAPMTRMMLFG